MTEQTDEQQLAAFLAGAMSNEALGVRLMMMSDEGLDCFGRVNGLALVREAGARLERNTWDEDRIPTCRRGTYGCPVDHEGDESCQTL